MTHELPPLPYAFDALEPYMDAKTMEIHHDKHHAGYVKKLNAALEKYPELQKKLVDKLLGIIDEIPEEIRTAVIQNGGGHSNHSMFWHWLSPKKQKPEGKIKRAIEKEFGSLEEFKKKFSEAAINRFGSGWAWLVFYEGKIEIISTPNQDSPLMNSRIPLLGLDVWEHAYYLKYQNRRTEYIEAFWNMLNWRKVNELYEGLR